MYQLFRRFYAMLFSSSKLFEKINNRFLDLALAAKGFNNFKNMSESGERYFVEKYLSNKDITLCFDIGANKGDYTKLLCEKTSANVISFEPLPFVFDKLKENLSSFSDRCEFVNKGVASRSEQLKINFNKDASSHASFSKEVDKIDYLNNANSLEIEVISLDEFCHSNNINKVDFIKIDTEGYEKEVFEGAKNVFGIIRPKFIQIEFNWHQLFRNTSLNFFAEQLTGYNVYQLTYKGMKRVDSRHPYSNIYMFSNFVFIRSDID
jgi:FkbM family methyltransferase